jgi:hypothetical protein
VGAANRRKCVINIMKKGHFSGLTKISVLEQ